MGEKKLHYKMYKDGKKFVFAAIATLSFFVFGGVSTVAVHADTTSGNLTAATVNSTSDTKSAVSSAATVASSVNSVLKNINVNSNTATTITASDSAKTDNATTTAAAGDNTKTDNTATTTDTGNSTKTDNTATTAATGDNTKTDNTATTTDTGNSTKTDNTATTAATGDNTKTDNTVTTTDTGNSTKTDNTATTAAAGDNTKTDNTATTTAVGDSAKTDNIMASSAANNNLPNSTTVQVSYQNLLTQLSSSSELNADSEALTNVTKDNFEDYFSLNGSATYDQTTGIVTITPDENNKVGSFFLKSKIDMNTSFTLTGQVNLGNKTSSQGGADGVGFAFHTGNTTDIGNAGGNLGIGGLQNAIGFKLDTFHNDYGTPWANEDGAQVAPTDPDGYGYDADPDRTKFPQFGAFVKTSQKLVQAQDGHYYSRWWDTTDMSSVQELNSRDLDGQFHDSVVSYDGSNRKLTIKYTETGGDVLTWSTSISDAYKAMAMVVSASTGYYKNLQQFKISSFDFKQAATVNVKYVDQKGNQLAQGTVSYPSGADVNGTYTTGQLEIPNYKFVRMDDGTATGAKSLPATGTLTKAGDNGTVIYVYAPAYTQTSKTISETIKYTDQDGKEVAIGYTADPITFVTVTNPVDNTTTTYYSTKAKTATLDDNGVPTEAGWTKADSTDFAEVVNPEVDGYKVISNDAPNSDLTSVAVQTVYTNSSDLDFTVVYAPAYSTSKVKTVTETVHYIGQDGKPVANDASGIPTSFVTITNPIDGSTATYYSKTESGQPTLNNNGVPVGDWTQGNSTDFAAIINPSVIGQHVVSTTDPGNDLTQTTVKSIDSNSDNLDFTVTYEPNQEAANVTYIDDTTGKTLSAKDLTGDYGSTDPYRTGDTIADYEKQGYQLVSDNYPTNGVVYNQDSTVQSFEVHLTHGTTQTSESQTVNETIHYVYKNGDKAADDYQATPLNFTRTVTTDKVTGKKTYGSWSSDQSFAAVTSPELKGYTADKAQIDKQTVNGDSKDLEFTVTYTKNAPTMTTDTKTVNETVSYVDQNGNELAQPHTVSVDFTRQVSTDAVTGEKTYGAWSSDQSFAAVTSPELKGYTADKAQIDKQTVNGDSKDLEFKVTYTKTPVAGGNVTAKYVDENGNPIADDVIASGNVGDPYSTTQKDVPGYTFKEVQGNPTGSFTDQDQTVTYVYTKNPATDNNGGTGLNQPGNPSQPSNATNNGVINTSTNTGSKVNNGAVNSPELPQTGENNSQSQTMSFIGILLAMFGSLLGFLGIKKRRND
ncbi:lectin-like domain-containing protein [Lacticaseibacillus paracasei]|uniref:lectin-like domain-containing protein n=2 Tax=Lactobacillaceae TaxID=33958 RepID=UPI00345E0079